MNKGTVVQVIGSTLDAEFSEKLPALYNALELQIDLENDKRKLTVEVQQHIGDNRVRCVSLGSTDGIRRGQDILDTGTSVQVPVGEVVLGRVLNLLHTQPICPANGVFAAQTLALARF